MSKFGMQVADETVYGIKTPDKALELIEKVIEQYFGEYWTQHKPRCPLCNEALQDTEKYMNRPVGECVNEKCDSTIHISDFMGKMKDILSEWGLAKDTWMEEVQEELKKKVKAAARVPALRQQQGFMTVPSDGGTEATHHAVNTGDTEVIDEEMVFVW